MESAHSTVAGADGQGETTLPRGADGHGAQTDVSARERNGADPYRKTQKATNLWLRPCDIPERRPASTLSP